METKMNKKINQIGKAGRIFATIAAVFSILASALVIAGIGITASLPKDALKVEVTGTADVTAKGSFLESITNAIIDSSKGGEGKIYIGSSDGHSGVAVGDVENSVPEGVEAQKTDKGISLSVKQQKLNLNVQAVLIALVATLVNTICLIVILFMIRALMKSIEICDTPFNTDVIKKMKRFGYSLIPFAIISGMSESAWQCLLSPGVTVHLGIDLKVVFVILIVFMLAMIFSYGAELQRESDETL